MPNLSTRVWQISTWICDRRLSQSGYWGDPWRGTKRVPCNDRPTQMIFFCCGSFPGNILISSFLLCKNIFLIIHEGSINYSNIRAVQKVCNAYDLSYCIRPSWGLDLGSHHGVAAHPCQSVGKQSTKVNRPSTCGLFLVYVARSLIVRPYADSFKYSKRDQKNVFLFKYI